MSKQSALSERYAVPILLELFKNPEEETKFMDLKPIVQNYNTLEKLVEKLEDAGLVTYRKVMRPYKTNYVMLTDLGKKVTKQLEIVDLMLEGEEIESSEPDFVSTPSQIRDRVT